MFQKFMNKKDFHPGSKWNIKRVWMAEQKQSAEQQREAELAEQYKREQDKFENRQLVSKDDKLKLGLSFIYDAPPGFKDKNKDKDELSEPIKEEEVKFEWLKGAPRESYTKDLNLETHAQPFGIPVRNVRCIKCHKWGHINTDRECPLYNTTISTEASSIADAAVSDPLKLMEDMRNDGLALKQNALGRVLNKDHPNQQYLASDDDDDGNDDDPELAFLATLNEKQKRKLLRKLNKLENKEQAKKKKKKREKNSSESEGERKTKHEKKSKKYDKSYSCDSERGEEARKSNRRKDDERNKPERNHRKSDFPEHERSDKYSLNKRKKDVRQSYFDEREHSDDAHSNIKERRDKETGNEDSRYKQKERVKGTRKKSALSESEDEYSSRKKKRNKEATM